MRLALPCAWLLFCGCAGCQQPPALVVKVHYEGFRPDCVVVQAAGGEREFPLGRTAPAQGDLSVAVWPQPGAGPGAVTDVVASARLSDCEGPVAVIASELAVAWPSSGSRSIPLQLLARDVDNDGFLEDAGPSGLQDCDDGDPAVFPRDGGEPLCDGKDEDCRGGADDTFLVGAACAADGGCGTGAIACAPGGPSQSTTCAAQPVPEYWVDGDRDGYGGDDAGFSCSPPSGWVRERGDCDDLRWWINPDAGEVCDQVDDDCDGVVDDLGGQRCDRIQVPGLTAPPQSSNGPRLAMAGVGRVVVVGGSGGVAYVEGDGGVLWRGGVCAGDWYSAWVNPANDRVFLGGTSGALGALERTGSCLAQQTAGNYHFGLWAQADGGPNPLINWVDVGAHYGTWVVPGSISDHGVQITPCCGNLRSIDGRPSGVMMACGWLWDTVQRHARVLRSPGQGQAFVDLRVEDALADAGLGTMQAALHDVTFPRDDLAYAVGESSAFVQWNGSGWAVLPPVNAIRSQINSVVAFSEQHVYLATGNFILRWNGTGYSVVVFAENTIFSMVRGTGPDDLWAVANGQVWHFSAGP